MVKIIGILTLSLHTNFGGIIQAVALSHWLQSRGWETTLLKRRRPLSGVQALALPVLEYLPFQNIKGVRHREKSRKRHEPFIASHFDGQTAVLRSSKALARAVDKHKLDAIVVGSDQVWQVKYLDRSTVTDFFLGFGAEDAYLRLSYAASFGVGTWNFPEYTPEVSRLLARFKAVSVREASGVNICRDDLGRPDAQHVLDPTLLVSPDFYSGICGSKPTKSDKNVLCYMLDHPTIRSQILAELGPAYREETLSLEHSDRLTVPAWISSFRDADFVVTDSYHGTIFSIIFERPFISIANEERGAERFTSLLALLGLSDRLIRADAPGRIAELVATPIDFVPVRAALARLRRLSEDYLKDTLA